MKRTPIAHIVFPRPNAVRPVPEFTWEAVRALTRTQDLDVDAILLVPVRTARGLQGLIRETAWPKNLDEQLRKLEPSPTLVPYLPIPGRSVESAAAAASAYLMRRPRAGRPKVVQGSFLDKGGFVASMVARVLNVPSIVVAHGSDVRAARGLIPGGGRRKRRALSALAWADRVIAGSEHLVKELALLGARAEPLSFTSHPELFSLDARLKNGAVSRPEVLFVGRLGKDKGADVLLQAFARMRRQDAKLRMVGASTDGLDLTAMSRRLGLEGRVRFEGEVPQGALPSLYASAACLALPARTEGRPNVLVESLLVGRPVVATRLGAFGALVDEQVGRLVEAGDPESLANALDQVLTEREKGRFAPETLRARALPFSWDSTGPKLAELTRGLL